MKGEPEDPVERRLQRIVETLGGRDAGASDDEIWFEPASAPGLQVRLGRDLRAPSFDRSANFALSYGATGRGEGVPPMLPAVVAHIKELDRDPLPGLAPAFRSAAQAVARRSAPGRSPGPDADRAREDQNAIFLDLCASLVGGGPDRVTPLHWGFWPEPDGEPGPGFDPFLAFSRHLLEFVPRAASRILDVGCGLGFNEGILSERGAKVTALSPVARHCEVVARANLPGVEVRCGRFEDLEPREPFDLLLFSESVNHFPLDADFFRRCRALLGGPGSVLMADDLTGPRRRDVERQGLFRVLEAVDISRNVEPTTRWFGRHVPAFAAYRRALMDTLHAEEPALAARLGAVLDRLPESELKSLLSGEAAPPALKGRYMIYLLGTA